MGRTLSKTVVIELNGCCGCGKSTLAANVERMLRQRNIRYAKLSGLLNRYSGSVNIKAVCDLIHYTVSIRPLRLERKEYFKHVLKIYNALIQAGKEGEYDVILLDEGIIQGLSSIAYQDMISGRKAVDAVLQVLLKDINMYIVNCNLKYKELVLRINKRNRNTGRIDKYKEGVQLINVLRTQNRNLHLLRQSIPVGISSMDVDMLEESSYNAQRILDAVYETQNKK